MLTSGGTCELLNPLIDLGEGAGGGRGGKEGERVEGEGGRRGGKGRGRGGRR